MSEAFDRDYRLAELLPDRLLETLGLALAQSLNADIALLDANGKTLWGNAPDAATRVPLTLEVEPVGYLAGPLPAERLKGAAMLLRQVLVARVRYLMAGSLHKESVAADYAALLEKHAALQASEARYRVLSAELEQRVADQVRLLDERQRQLYQAEKLASVGQLAAGVAHEVNNPIGFVRSNIVSLGRHVDTLRQLARRLADAPAAWRELDMDYVVADSAEIVADCIEGIDRVARIVADLRGFANIDRPSRELVDLNANLEEVVNVFRGQLPPGVAVRLDRCPLPRVACFPGHINQALLGTLRNAVQAVQDAKREGTVVVRSRAVEHGVEVVIEDSGVGMAPAEQARIFDPFYTTRVVGQGVGLGMTVARDVVQAHGGRIAVDSEPNVGTKITIFLPS
jgi:signal transduction histidine kinase